MDKRILFIFCFVINFVVPLDIECTYKFLNYYAVGQKYECLVSNNIFIDSPENIQITSIIGTHMSGKDDDSEIYFRIFNKEVQYFPRGMEKFYKNLRGIVIMFTQLKEIHQEDLKPFPKLNNLFLSGNNIEVIEDGLFDYNPDMEVVMFENMKLFHIGSTVFDNLGKLTTLYLSGNKCTTLQSTNNRTGTISVINSIKGTCVSADFINLMKKLDNLEEISENSVLAGSEIFIKNVIDFQAEFKSSKFANFSPLKQKFQKMLKIKIKSPYEDILMNFSRCAADSEQCSALDKKLTLADQSLSTKFEILDQKLNKTATQLKQEIEKDLEDFQQNILKAVESKIEDLESRLTRRIEDILDEKLRNIING